MYAGTDGQGVWRRPIPVAAAPAPSTAAFVMRVLPNPATSQMNVAFTLEHGGTAELEIADLLGRRMRSVSLGSLEAGEHRAAIDCRDLPSGWYMVRLRRAGGVLSQGVMVK